MSLTSQIIQLKKQFIADNGDQPKNIHIPKEFEVDLHGVLLDAHVSDKDIKSAKEYFKSKGNKIQGMNIIWDAEELKVSE